MSHADTYDEGGCATQAEMERDRKKDHPFSVLHWGSHPDLDNDDCFTGEDFDTVEEAIAAYHQDPSDSSVEYIEIDGIEDADLPKYGITRVRKNPHFVKEASDTSDREWQSEFAHQQGMAFGIDAYNEAMGWDSGED